MPDTLSQQANKKTIDSVKAETPDKFTVGGHYDHATRTVTGGVTYDRKLSNAFGVTAYWNAYWNDRPIYPQDKFGMVIGGQAVYEFNRKP